VTDGAGVDGAALGAGVFTTGGGTLRRAGGVVSLIAGAWEDFAIGVGNGVGLIGIEGGTRGVRIAGEIDATGVAVAVAAAETRGVVIGVAEADAAVEGTAVADSLGLAMGDGRMRGVADVAGVALAEVDLAVAVAVGLLTGFLVAAGVGLAVALGVAAGVAVAFATGVAFGVATGVAVAGVAGVADADVVIAVGAGVADAVVVVDASAGLTNFFGGAFGGGVASVFILARARSAAERSAIAVQPVSMFNSITRSFTRRGRGMLRTSVITGAEMSSSSPRTVAIISVFWRRRR
jgi:hypothetical protein